MLGKKERFCHIDQVVPIALLPILTSVNYPGSSYYKSGVLE